MFTVNCLIIATNENFKSNYSTNVFGAISGVWANQIIGIQALRYPVGVERFFVGGRGVWLEVFDALHVS